MQELELLGVPGSPYTRKMLALLRYRRIPHRMIWGSHFEPLANYPAPKVKLLPTFYFPTANAKKLSLTLPRSFSDWNVSMQTETSCPTILCYAF